MKTPALDIMLKTLNLTSTLAVYRQFSERASTEGWSYEQYLQELAEEELQTRAQRRTARLLKQSGLPSGKNLATLRKEWLPQKMRTLLPKLVDGDFTGRAENLLLFGLPGRGKTHLAAAIGHELIVRHSLPVLFTTAFSLVQKLLKAKAELRIEAEFARLDKFDAIILDDIGYLQQKRDEMEILFTFIGECYERKSLIITSNLVFSQWDKIFKDPMTTAAAIDRLVHHSIIINVEGKSKRDPKFDGNIEI